MNAGTKVRVESIGRNGQRDWSERGVVSTTEHPIPGWVPVRFADGSKLMVPATQLMPANA
jgi:hypothetical protein